EAPQQLASKAIVTKAQQLQQNVVATTTQLDAGRVDTSKQLDQPQVHAAPLDQSSNQASIENTELPTTDMQPVQQAPGANEEVALSAIAVPPAQASSAESAGATALKEFASKTSDTVAAPTAAMVSRFAVVSSNVDVAPMKASNQNQSGGDQHSE